MIPISFQVKTMTIVILVKKHIQRVRGSLQQKNMIITSVHPLLTQQLLISTKLLILTNKELQPTTQSLYQKIPFLGKICFKETLSQKNLRLVVMNLQLL